MATLTTSALPLTGGAAAITGLAKKYRLLFGGTYAVTETVTLTFTDVGTGRQLQVGYGQATGIAPTFIKTYKKKVYLVSGTSLFFSALQEPEQLNDTNQAGLGFMALDDEYGLSDSLLGIAIYQGKLAVFARRSIQIVRVDPDPANNEVGQTLENIGTVNGNSVRGIGDFDILFCSDSGVRSLRVRDSSGNALTVDLGTPIDAIIQARIRSVGSSTMASIVEPNGNRYWLSIGNVIYIFTYFPTSDVIAWSTYTPSYQSTAAVNPVSSTYDADGKCNFTGLTVGNLYRWTAGGNDTGFVNGSKTITSGKTFRATATTAYSTGTTGQSYTGTFLSITHTTFTPERFDVIGGNIYVRSTAGKIYKYGGSDGNQYDAAICSWETPWLDSRTPATQKLNRAIDAGIEGEWLLKTGTDPVSGTLTEVYRNNVSSFNRDAIPSIKKGTHIKVRGETCGEEYARTSSIVLHQEGGDAR